MRKITLAIISLFLFTSGMEGSETIRTAATANQGFAYRFADPIQFETRGIRYFVFPDGTFKFTLPGRRHFYGRRSHRHFADRTPGYRYGRNRFYFGKRIVRNRYGDIIRIGRTPVLYDFQGRVKRIGPVAMRYGRFNLLSRIGDMQVRYTPRGKLVFARGHVQPDYCGIHGRYGCRADHFGYAQRNGRYHDWQDWNDDWDDDDWDDDDWDDDDWEDRERKRRRKRYGKEVD